MCCQLGAVVKVLNQNTEWQLKDNKYESGFPPIILKCLPNDVFCHQHKPFACFHKKM